LKRKPINFGAALLIAAAVGGCSTVSETVGDPFISPAKFQFLRCNDIAKRLTAAEARNQELHSLIDRSNAGFGGSAVSVFVYGPDLKGVEAEIRLLRQTAGEKRCGDELIKTDPKPPDTSAPR
jgi:hypothetical protein